MEKPGVDVSGLGLKNKTVPEKLKGTIFVAYSRKKSEFFPFLPFMQIKIWDLIKHLKTNLLILP
jgi:hypothetical protein